MMFTGAPIACFTSMFAGDLIRILMGPQWDTAGSAAERARDRHGGAAGIEQHRLDLSGARRDSQHGAVGLVGWGVMIAAALVGLLLGGRWRGLGLDLFTVCLA